MVEKKINSNVIVFAGAGSSAAVDNKKYPTTAEFFNRLPGKISNDPLFTNLSKFLSKKLNGKKIDIEVILWELDNIASYCKTSIGPETYISQIVDGNTLAGILGTANQNFGHAKSLLGRLEKSCSNLVDAINTVVYDLYADEPEPHSIEGNWVALLNALLEKNLEIEVFTTNYDLVIESAFDAVGRNQSLSGRRLTAGWQGNVTRTLDLNLWNEPGNRFGYDAILTKLHGSVDWSKRGDSILVGDPSFKGDHSKHSIIYPGYKSRPSDPLFQGFHNRLARQLQSANLVIFIGFAFRDEYINSLCERYISPASAILIVNPDKELKLPFGSRRAYHHIDGFDARVADFIGPFFKRSVSLS